VLRRFIREERRAQAARHLIASYYLPTSSCLPSSLFPPSPPRVLLPCSTRVVISAERPGFSPGVSRYRRSFLNLFAPGRTCMRGVIYSGYLRGRSCSRARARARAVNYVNLVKSRGEREKRRNLRSVLLSPRAALFSRVIDPRIRIKTIS